MNQLLVTQSIVCPQETDHVFDKLAVWGPHGPRLAHFVAVLTSDDMSPMRFGICCKRM